MCGIFGYVGDEIDAAELVHSGLKGLEYRGYDSWGIAVAHKGEIRTARDTGKLTDVPRDLPLSEIAIGHTRWATTGAVTEDNAHPHSDCSGRLAIVHNGIIENFVMLREGLRDRGHIFMSDTDSEVAAHLLEEELGSLGDVPLSEALRLVALRLEGLNAIVALDVVSGELAAVKNGSPLIVGLSADKQYLASDMASLLLHTRDLMFVEDGQVISLRKHDVRVFEAATGLSIPLHVEHVDWSVEDTTLGDFHHYLEKEIWEQPAILRRIAAEGLPEAEKLAGYLQAAAHIYLVACGTAYHAALASRYLLNEGGYGATAVHAHEFSHMASLVTKDDVVVAFSQSGETIDVVDAIRLAKERGATVVGLVNVPGSTLTRLVDWAIMLGAGPEKSVLSTKTFTAKIAYMVLTVGLIRGRDLRKAINNAAETIDLMPENGIVTAVRTIAHHIVDKDHLFVLGRGIGYPLALEAALKVKEVTYMHAEGLPAGELKHGTIALIEPGVPVIVLAPDNSDAAHMLTAAGEVQARGAYVIGVGPVEHPGFDAFIAVPCVDDAFILAVLPVVQLLAYELALLRGHDPDKPRNLAKSVTVR